MTTPSVWIIGGGKIGVEYAKILQYLGVDYKIFTRSSRKELIEWGERVEIVNFLDCGVGNRKLPTHVIVATNIASLLPITKVMLAAGVQNILVEKPLTLSWRLLAEFDDSTKVNYPDAYIAVALNRRFYGFNPQLKQFLLDRGGCTDVQMCFGEPIEKISRSMKPDEEKSSWLAANTIHLFDYIFWMIDVQSGMELELLECSQDYWEQSHHNYSMFSGKIKAGTVILHYHTDWRSDARWNVKLYTQSAHIRMAPLEEPEVCENFQNKVMQSFFLTGFDEKFKAGFYSQTCAFLNGETDTLASVPSVLKTLKIISQIQGVTS